MGGEGEDQEKEREKEGLLCPRCGSKGYLEYRRRGDQTYVYMHHRIRDEKGVRTKTCYLGAETYDYVERLNPMGLKDMLDRDRFYDYALAIIDRLTPDELLGLKREIERRMGGSKDEG
jgi:hypothetical protein